VLQPTSRVTLTYLPSDQPSVQPGEDQ
jgi:hypothetical protein